MIFRIRGLLQLLVTKYQIKYIYVPLLLKYLVLVLPNLAKYHLLLFILKQLLLVVFRLFSASSQKSRLSFYPITKRYIVIIFLIIASISLIIALISRRYSSSTSINVTFESINTSIQQINVVPNKQNYLGIIRTSFQSLQNR